MSIATRINAIEEHIGSAYDKIEDLGIDLTNVDKNINNIATQLEQVYNDYPKVTASNVEETSLSNTKAGKMKVDLKGNTSQANLVGNNLMETTQSYSSTEYYGVTGTTNDDGTITLNGTATRAVEFKYMLDTTSIQLEANQNYMLQSFLLEGTASQVLIAYSLNGAVGTFTSETKNLSSSSSNRTLAQIRIYINSGVSYTNAKIGVMLFKGSSATNQYEKYMEGPSPELPSSIQNVSGNNTITISNSDGTEEQNLPINLGDIELCKIGTAQDYFYKDSGKWYLHKEIGNMNLFDVDYWNYNTPGSFYCINFVSKYGYVSGNGLSNLFKYSSTSWTSNCFGISSTGSLWIDTGDTSLLNNNSVKSWLSNKNGIMYGILATPTNTEITETTLINQLEAILTAKSYNEQTNISQTNSDLPFILDLAALRGE